MAEQTGTYHPKCQETNGIATVLCKDVTLSRVEYGNETQNLEFHAAYKCPICGVVEVKKIDERLANNLSSKNAAFQVLELSLDKDTLNIEFDLGPIHAGEFANLLMDLEMGGPAAFEASEQDHI